MLQNESGLNLWFVSKMDHIKVWDHKINNQ